MKTLAKSLHTVTVLVRIGRTYMNNEGYHAVDAVAKALEDLGYTGCADPYDLARTAQEQLQTSAFMTTKGSR